MNKCASRLKEERARLGMTQDAFAEVAGVSKRAVANYEGGERKPDSDFLTAIAAAGADVLYILTGQRGAPLATAQPPAPHRLSAEEAKLVAEYRECSEEGKEVVRAASRAAARAGSALRRSAAPPRGSKRAA